MGLEHIRKLKEEARLPKQKKAYQIPKKSKKKLAYEKEQKENKKDASGEKERWFQDRRKEMLGRCSNCGRKSFRDSNEYFRFSVAHILAKRKSMFPSVATHPDNWIELCGDCHTNLDQCMIDLTDLACWDEVVVKFQKIYPHIAKDEKHRIPNILLQYINTDR